MNARVREFQARDYIQKCCVAFIAHVTKVAQANCAANRRKTIVHDDVLGGESKWWEDLGVLLGECITACVHA
jgi:hypothetical protein